MKKSGLIVAALGLAFTAAPALASLELATKSGCTACHAVDKKLVGPAYQDVAAKYKGNPKAEAMLIQKVEKGGVGTWGQVPMPPNANVKPEDVKKIVHWVLSLPPAKK
jgi:cytochrome c